MARPSEPFAQFCRKLGLVLGCSIPTIGGVATGLIFHYLTDDGRVRSVADVIEGAALH